MLIYAHATYTFDIIRGNDYVVFGNDMFIASALLYSIHVFLMNFELLNCVLLKKSCYQGELIKLSLLFYY